MRKRRSNKYQTLQGTPTFDAFLGNLWELVWNQARIVDTKKIETYITETLREKDISDETIELFLKAKADTIRRTLGVALVEEEANWPHEQTDIFLIADKIMEDALK